MAQPNLDRVQSDFQEQHEDAVPAKQLTFEARIWKFLKGVVTYVPIIILMVLPKFAGYVVGYAVAFGWTIFMLGVTFYQKKTGSIKVWPKILDIGFSLLSLALLITELVAHPGDEFHDYISGIIVNSAFAFIVLASIIIQVPFTIQYARDTMPESRWNHPAVRFGCFVTAWLWFAIFCLMVISQCIPLGIHADPHSTTATIFTVVIPLVILILGFKLTARVVAMLQERGKKAAAHGGGDNRQEIAKKDFETNQTVT